MKKSLLLVLLTLFACIGLSAAAPKNYIRNGQFLELKSNHNLADGVIPAPWYTQYSLKNWPAENRVSTTERPNGSKSNSYVVTGQYLICQTSLPVTPGKTYRFSCMMKTKGMPWTAQARFQVIWIDKSGRELMRDYTDNKGKVTKGWDHQWVWTGSNHEWKEYTIPAFTAPANAKYAKIRIGKTGKNEGYAYFADLKMEECPSTDPVANRVGVIPYGKSFADAAVFDDFIIPGTGTKSQHPTTVYAYYDDQALNIKVNNHQQSVGGEQFMDTVVQNNSDAIELLFLPKGYKEQFHLLASPSGANFGLIEEWSDKVWPFKRREWQVASFGTKVKVDENDWIVTTRIPFSAMGLKSAPADGEEWRMSFCRNVQTRGQELSAWANLPSPHFQRTEGFGRVIFRKSGLVANSPKLTPAAVTTTVRNLSKDKRTLTVNRIEHGDKGGFNIASEKYEIAPNGKKDIQFNNKIDSKKVLWTEIRDNGVLISKHCALPTSTYLAFEFLDPEKVRTQTVYLATDTPFFIAWHMRHNLPSKVSHSIIQRYQKPVDFVLEVPEGINFRGVMHDASAYRWTQSKLCPPTVKSVTVNGKKYNQFRFPLPIIGDWREPQWLFFYDCSLKPGMEFTGKAWFIVDGKIESETEKQFKTIKVGKVRKTFERLPFNIGLMDAVTLYNWFPEKPLDRYYELGFNCLSIPVKAQKNKEFYKGNNPQSDEDYYDIMYQDFLKDKRPFYMNTVSITTAPTHQVWTRTDQPETVGIKRDGTKCTAGGYQGSPGLCFNYRGPLHKQWVERLVSSSAFNKYRLSWLALDMELWRPPAWDEICFCEKCMKLFKEFCIKKNRPDIAALNPRTADSADFKKLWSEFQVVSAAGFVEVAIDAVRAKVKGARRTSPWGDFSVQDYGGMPGLQYTPDSLDIFEQSVYFTPEGNYKKLSNLRKNAFKNNSRNLATGLSFGQTGGCPDWQMTAENAKESIFEVMIHGTQHVVYYYDLYIDPLRMKHMVDALNATTPCEDIILDGFIVEDVKTSDKNMIATHRILKDEALLALRTYYADKTVTAKVTFDKVASPVKVFDAENGKVVGELTPAKPYFNYTLGKNKCKLFFIGTQAQWDKRYK